MLWTEFGLHLIKTFLPEEFQSRPQFVLNWMYFTGEFRRGYNAPQSDGFFQEPIYGAHRFPHCRPEQFNSVGKSVRVNEFSLVRLPLKDVNVN